MILNQLICRVASVYPEAGPMNYWDPARQALRTGVDGNDTLARFIVENLAETFDPDADDGTQIAVAVREMQYAADILASVAHALSTMSLERIAAYPFLQHPHDSHNDN